MKTYIKGHFFTLRNVVSASFLGILAALERHLFFTSLRRDAPFPSLTLNLHEQFRRVWKGTKARACQSLSVVSRAERDRGFSPQSSQVAHARNMSISEHRYCCEYKDLYEKKTYRFCNVRKWKDFNKKNSLPYLICVLRLSCVVHRPIYGRFL